MIGFYAGEDSVYTLTFTHTNSEDVYPNIYLVDLKKDSTIDVTESGTQYTFLRSKLDTLVDRFKIVTNNGITTDKPNLLGNSTLNIFSTENTVYIHNFSDVKGDLKIYDVSGRIIEEYPFNSNGISTLKLNLPSGVYLARGIAGNKMKTTRLVLK